MNLQESIRRILREEMNKEVKWLVRRLEDPDVMDDLDATVKSTTMFTKACGMTEYDFFDEVMENSVHNFINHWEELNNRGDCNIMYVPEQYNILYRFSNLWDMVPNDINELEEALQLEKELLSKEITVYSVQKNFDVDYVKRMDDERYDKSDISLFKYKNKLYIIDGHHRLCYDRINNRDSYVYIFDKDDSEFVDCIFYGIGDC